MPPRLSEAEMSSIVMAGGGRYVGVLKEVPDKMELIVLFLSPQTRTTLGIPISRLTVDAVRKQLAESDAAFARAGSKRQMQSARTLEQFSDSRSNFDDGLPCGTVR